MVNMLPVPVEEEIERLWKETEQYIAEGKGGYIIEKNPTTYAEEPVQFNDNLDRNNTITVYTDSEIEVAEMFWVPHVFYKTAKVFEDWMNRNKITIDELNSKLSYYVLEFRSKYKDWLFALAKRMLGEDKPKPFKHVVVTVKTKPAVKAKPVHKNKAVVGTAVATPLLAALSVLYHALPKPIGVAIVGAVCFVLSVVEHTDYKRLIEEVEE